MKQHQTAQQSVKNYGKEFRGVIGHSNRDLKCKNMIGKENNKFVLKALTVLSNQ